MYVCLSVLYSLQTRYKEQKQIFTEMGSSKGTDQERGEFKELALFIAEMFYRVRIINKKVCLHVFLSRFSSFLSFLPSFVSFFFPLYMLTTMLSATNDKPSNTYIENTIKIQTIPGTKFVTLLASA